MITGVVGMAHHLAVTGVPVYRMLLAAALITAAIAQVNPAPPAATTGAADGITTSAATVHGTVNPNGAATTYHVDYGTTSGYGLHTADVDAGSGTDAANVSVALSGLTSDTTYHFSVVATNAAGTARGADHTLHTAIVPHTPIASTRPATAINPLGATLGGSITPRGVDTSVHFLYGLTSSYGSQTGDVAAGAGSSPVTVRIAIAGLQPNTRYHFRAIATNAKGSARGGDRTFTTGKAPTAVTITPSTSRVVWGNGLQLTGAVTGIGSVPVHLQRLDFPYGGDWAEVASTTAASNGGFAFTVPPLRVTTRLRVLAGTSIVASSQGTTISVAVKVGMNARRPTRKRVRLEGTIWPQVPSGRVSLQRQTPRGHWHTVARAKPRRLSGDRSHYRFSVKRLKRAQRYRALVTALDAGAHSPGASRTVRVGRRR
jgi:hypothetical protein